MSLDERLFGWLYRNLRRRRGGAEGALSPNAVALDDLHGRLELVASALSGQSTTVRAAEDVGGVRGSTLLLPVAIDLFDDAEQNAAAYVHRVVYGVASRSLGFVTDGLPDVPAVDQLGALLAVPATRAHISRDLPSAQALWDRVVAGIDGPGQLSDEGSADEARTVLDVALGSAPREAGATSRLATNLDVAPPRDADELIAFVKSHHEALERIGPALIALARPYQPLIGRLFARGATVADGDSPDERRGAPPEAGGTEQLAPRRDEVEVLDLGKGEENENPLVHSFEKVHTLDDYKGGSKRHDGEDQLDEQLAALDELDLRQVVRTPEPAQAVLKLDGLFEGFAGEVESGEDAAGSRPRFEYDEWDAAKGNYRPEWCTLYLETSPRRAEAEAARQRVQRVRREHARQLRDLRAMMEALEMERRWRNRQLDGSELDLDALVDRRAALAAGRTPDDRVYASRRRHERELATLVLLDLSLSSDSWIADRRVLDVARDAIIVLGEVLDGSADEFAVAGFQSHTRRECRWLPLKGFDDPWPLATERLLAVEPAGYTRIGPALRHGIRVLSEHGARRRLLLLVTDAKPTDYDRYEGRYGMDDVRQAFREAEQQDIHPFAVTIAEAKGSTLPRMFGAGRYEVLERPDDLPAVLTEVYTRLAR